MAKHPAYLDPAVMILLAAFDTMARENVPRMVRGTTQLGRRQQAADHEQLGNDAEHSAGATAWLKSMLGFHRSKT